jgi:hypothetical protein
VGILQHSIELGGGGVIVRPRSVARALGLDREAIQELEAALGHGHIYPQTLARRAEVLAVLPPIIASDDARRRAKAIGRARK